MRLGLIDMILQWMQDAMASTAGNCTANKMCYHPTDGEKQKNHLKAILKSQELWPIPKKEEWKGSFWVLGQRMVRRIWSHRGPAGFQKLRSQCWLCRRLYSMPSWHWQHWDFTQAKRYLCEDFQAHDDQLSQHARLLGTLPSSVEAEPAIGPYCPPRTYRVLYDE